MEGKWRLQQPAALDAFCHCWRRTLGSKSEDGVRKAVVCFFSLEALEKNIFMVQLCLVDGGVCVCIYYIIYVMVLDACGSRGRCGSVSHMTAPSELPNRTSVGG